MLSLNERANYRNDSDIFREYSTETRLRGSKHKSSWQIMLQQKHFASWSYLMCVQVKLLQPISGSEFGIWNLPVSYKLPYISLSLWKIRTSLQLKLISLSHLIYKRKWVHCRQKFNILFFKSLPRSVRNLFVLIKLNQIPHIEWEYIW